MKEYKAGIYLRLSKEHNEENNSIEAQREITVKYAITKGYTVAKEYIDNGYSGILDSRPALNKMMMDISRGSINMVIVKDISRLTRDKNKTGWYTEIFFPDNDVRFISVTEGIDTGERYEIDDSIMLRGIANQYYIADISRKVKSNKNAMKQNGLFVENRAPYGYKKDKNNKHKVVIDKNVAQNIVKIYDMYIEGISSIKIAEYFNNQKIKTPSMYMKQKKTSKKWKAETINYILTNPFYIGNTITNKYETSYITKTCKENKNRTTWLIKENTHKPIIEKEKYEKVQNIKSQKKSNIKVKHEYLLKDLVYCGQCKRKIQYKVHKSKQSQEFINEMAVFNCNYIYKNDCKNDIHIKEKVLNEILKSEILKRLEIDKIKNKIVNYYKENNKKVKKIAECNKQKLERMKRNLYQKKCDNYITIEEFKQKYEKIKKEILQIQEQMQIIDKANKLLEENIEKLAYKNLLTNNFIKKIIEKIEIYPENKIEITFNM